MPNPLGQFPAECGEAAQIARGKQLFTNEVNAGGAGCASCHHNGNKMTNGVVDDTFQDFNILEPGVIAETTVSNDGVFLRLDDNYIFKPFAPPADVGGRQNISSRNTKHLRAFWDSVPRWLHHGSAHTIREILLGPDSPLLQPAERGFNFRTVRTDATGAWRTDFLGGHRSSCRPKCRSRWPTAADRGSSSWPGVTFAGDAKGRSTSASTRRRRYRRPTRRIRTAA